MEQEVTTKKWTVMVYMAGDNNLDKNGIIDLKEMKKAGSTADVNIIVQFDRAGKDLSTTRYYVQKGTSLKEDAMESIGEINTGNPDALVDFIKWGAKNYKAEHYMLVLWNHGQGWDDTDIFAGARLFGNRLMRTNRIKHALFETSVKQVARLAELERIQPRAILIDDNAKDFLDNLEMKKVLLEAKSLLGQKIDIFGMDACLMSMAEVVYQVKDFAMFMVGSEETEPLDGWPYDEVLNHLTANPDIKPEDLSISIVKKYVESYKKGREAVTQSACNLNVSEKFADAMEILSKALVAGINNSETLALVVNARNRVQEYAVKDNVDLVNFCQLLKNSTGNSEIVNACNGVVDAVRGASGMVISSEYIGESLEHSNGIAIYFPMRTISPLYTTNLDFTGRTGWGGFLKAYLKAARSQ